MLPCEPDDARAVLVEDDDADGEAEVLEVLADTEEISGEVVVGKEVIDFVLCLCGGLVCVIDKAAAVADFGVEHLAGGKCLVGLDEVDDVVGHLVVGTPRDVLHLIGDEDGGDGVLLLEYFGGVGGGKAADLLVLGMVTTDVGGVNEKSLISCFFRAKI